METKKYINLNNLSTFLSGLKEIFSAISHTHKVSDIADYKIDDSLSSSSINPVQNKIVNAEFEAVSTAMNVMEMEIDTINEFISNKPDENDAMELIAEMGLIEPTVDENGAVYTDENGVIYTL